LLHDQRSGSVGLSELQGFHPDAVLRRLRRETAAATGPFRAGRHGQGFIALTSIDAQLIRTLRMLFTRPGLLTFT